MESRLQRPAILRFTVRNLVALYNVLLLTRDKEFIMCCIKVKSIVDEYRKETLDDRLDRFFEKALG